jgi:hypothetical protein
MIGAESVVGDERRTIIKGKVWECRLRRELLKALWQKVMAYV